MAGIAARWLVGIIASAAILTGVALSYRAWRQHENAIALAIRAGNGIEETMFVPIGGTRQWIQIRGDDRSNPVILFMHGGPGASESPLSSLFRPWERSFTVVVWDQRCAGKTFARNGAASCKGLGVESVAREGIALAEFLRHHLHKKKIVALGHSWGTMIGVRMIKERPDLFSAYVGTGQVVSIPEKEPVIYARAMARLRAAHADDAIRELEKIHPPYNSHEELERERDLSDRYDIASERDLRADMTPIVLFAPGWSLWDISEFLQAPAYAEREAFDGTKTYDARRIGLDFEVPFFIFNGALDNVTPTDLARRYFDSVRAPTKAFVVIPGAGHSAVLTRSDTFLRDLVVRVRPVAAE